MNKLPVFKTDRLILRDINIYDASDMFEYSCSPLVGPMAGWEPHKIILETASVINLFIDSKSRGEPGVFAIVYRENNKMIGTIELYNYKPGFKAELGYALNPTYWGKGIIVEAANCLIDWGFNDLNLKRIEVATFKENYQSQRVCEKLGFQKEGIARNSYLRYDGMVCDKVMFSMTDLDYYGKMKKEYRERIW